MRPLLSGETPANWRKSMYYHYYEYPGWHMVKRHYGVRTERYKLIHFYHDIDAWEMYDLQTDPNELNNVYTDPDYADVRAKLQKELKKLRAQYGDSDALTEKLMRQHYEGICRRRTGLNRITIDNESWFESMLWRTQLSSAAEPNPVSSFSNA
jgi:arylsulfatase A-like enzyme